MINNALLDNDFINKLLSQTEQEVFARITVLTQKESPIESIEGKVTGGSINVDGKSAIRRSCSLSLVAEDIFINEFYWGLKNKFKLEIGLKNNVENKYDNIIWFPQGIYVITNFDTNLAAKKWTISIKGKDKMCLLNGELGGHLPHETNFGQMEYHDLKTDTVTKEAIPIKTIIKEAIRNYGNELPHNIIINNLEDVGFQLLEYRGNTPLYMFRKIEDDIFTNMTFNKNQICYYFSSNGWTQTTIDDSEHIIYDNLVNLEGEIKATPIRFRLDTFEQKYYVAKFDYGSTPGYKFTDLTYAPEDGLISKAGDTVVSVLDKIKKMLGDFEYFYNLDGKFVFQRQQKYNAFNWQGSEIDEVLYADATLNTEKPIFSFLNNKLITSFKNVPKIQDLKNDFSIWGVKRSPSGTENTIHARYAIDEKPKFYKAYDNKIYVSDKILFQNMQKTFSEESMEMVQFVDWREIIYQMSLDYNKYSHEDNFLYEIIQRNSEYYPTGQTGYERYYIDLNGFWRTLYDPNSIPNFEAISYLEAPQYYRNEDLYIQHSYRKLEMDEKDELTIDILKLYVLDYERDSEHPDIIPFLKSKYCKLEDNYDLYFYIDPETNIMNSGETDRYKLNKINLEDIYLKNRGPFISNEESYELNTNVNINNYSPNKYYLKTFKEGYRLYNNIYNSNLEYYIEDKASFDGYTKVSVGKDVYKPNTYYTKGLVLSWSEELQEWVSVDGYKIREESTYGDEIYYKLHSANYKPVTITTPEHYNKKTYYVVSQILEPDEDGYVEIIYQAASGTYNPNIQYYEIEDAHFVQVSFSDYLFEPNKFYIWQDAKYSLADKAYDENMLYYSLNNSRKHYYVKEKDSNEDSGLNGESKYQYWVFKYPFGTDVGQYYDDYVNYAALQLEKYLEEYKWDNLYIQTEGHIKFQDLDLDIQRLYYKQAGILTEYLTIPQYDNYNIEKTRQTEFTLYLYDIIPNNTAYKTVDDYKKAVLDIQKQYTGISTIIDEDILNTIYLINKDDFETEEEYYKTIQMGYNEYLKLMNEQYKELINEQIFSYQQVHYKKAIYSYQRDKETGNYWTLSLNNSPEDLIFWFDFINGETSHLSKYSVQAIGPRTKVVNDKDVKSIYYKEIPNSIFINTPADKDKYEYQTGYTYIQLNQGLNESLFVTSSKGKSAKEALDNLLYTNTYATENVTIQTVPIYHLQPNTCIYIRNDDTKIDGEYLISKLTIPFEHKKMMSITATKVIPSII